MAVTQRSRVLGLWSTGIQDRHKSQKSMRAREEADSHETIERLAGSHSQTAALRLDQQREVSLGPESSNNSSSVETITPPLSRRRPTTSDTQSVPGSPTRP